MVISGFPGIGKTFYSKHNYDQIDLDSTQFSKLRNGERNPNFPDNYIEGLKKILHKYNIIFVSSHKETREQLQKNNISYNIICPDIEKEGNKELFMKRYKTRKHHTNREQFVKLMENNFEKFTYDLLSDENADNIITIDLNEEMLTDIITDIKENKKYGYKRYV